MHEAKQLMEKTLRAQMAQQVCACVRLNSLGVAKSRKLTKKGEMAVASSETLCLPLILACSQLYWARRQPTLRHPHVRCVYLLPLELTG